MRPFADKQTSGGCQPSCSLAKPFAGRALGYWEYSFRGRLVREVPRPWLFLKLFFWFEETAAIISPRKTLDGLNHNACAWVADKRVVQVVAGVAGATSVCTGLRARNPGSTD